MRLQTEVTKTKIAQKMDGITMFKMTDSAVVFYLITNNNIQIV